MTFKVPAAPVKTIKEAATVGKLLEAVRRVGEGKLREAFRKNPFIYGTAGTKNIALINALSRLNGDRSTPFNKAPDPNRDMSQVTFKVGRALNLFTPGDRVKSYVNRGMQMMDMYYGQAGNSLHAMRSPAIAEFVHIAMDFEGKFSMQDSGRDTYMRTFKTKIEGWDGWTAGHPLYVRQSPNEPKSATHLTATKEISRIIRWAIQQLGGTLVFEGRELYYCQVFEENPARVSDTDLEARNLFKHFKPGLSNVPFGTGRLIFEWGGVETVPTQLHFRSNWKFANGNTHKLGNFEANHNLTGLLPIWKNFLEVPVEVSAENPQLLLWALRYAKNAA